VDLAMLQARLRAHILQWRDRKGGGAVETPPGG
jgi:hypothetical protein